MLQDLFASRARPDLSVGEPSLVSGLRRRAGVICWASSRTFGSAIPRAVTPWSELGSSMSIGAWTLSILLTVPVPMTSLAWMTVVHEIYRVNQSPPLWPSW